MVSIASLGIRPKYTLTTSAAQSLNVASGYVWFNSAYNIEVGNENTPALVLVEGSGSFMNDSRVLGLRLIRRTGIASWNYHQNTYTTTKNGSSSYWGAHLNTSNYYNSWMNGVGSSYAGNAGYNSSNTGETFHFRIWIKNHKKNLTSTQAASDVVAYTQMFSYDTGGTPQLTECAMRSRGTFGGVKEVGGCQVYANSGNINIRMDSYNIGSKLEN